MALTKGVSSVDAWQAIAQNDLVEGATVDISGAYQATLYIDAALTSITATTNGLKVIIQISSATTGDANWHELTSFGMLAGLTAATENLTNNPAGVGTTVFTCVDTTGFVTEGDLIYIKDATEANSELFVLDTFSTNVSVTALDGSINSHVLNTPMWNKAASITVSLPDSANRVRVIYDNTQDAAGSTVSVRANLSKITAI
jgi:hypothetical protein